MYCVVLGFFFLFKWSQLWSYPHFESAYHHSTWALYKKKKAVWHDRDLSLKNLLVFRCLFLISGVSTDKGWGKKQQINSRKRSSCFQARFRSETKQTLRHPTSHEEQVGILKPPMKLVSQEVPCRNRFYTVFRYLTRCISIKDHIGPEYKFRLYSTTTGVTINIW